MVKRRKAVAVAGLLAATAFISGQATSQASGSVVIGNWTNSTNDGWFDWGHSGGGTANNGNPGGAGNAYLTGLSVHGNPLYAYSSDGVESGASLLYQPAGPNGLNGGYEQSYGVKLEYQGDMGAFWANQDITFTMTYPAASLSGSTSGYAQVYQLFINAPGWGFKDISATKPVPGTNVYYYSGASQRTVTVTVPYASVLAAMVANGNNATTNQGYAEIIFATNSGSGAPGSVYLDQVSLTGGPVPEPTSLSLLGLAAAGLMRRRLRH